MRADGGGTNGGRAGAIAIETLNLVHTTTDGLGTRGTMPRDTGGDVTSRHVTFRFSLSGNIHLTLILHG